MLAFHAPPPHKENSQKYVNLRFTKHPLASFINISGCGGWGIFPLYISTSAPAMKGLYLSLKKERRTLSGDYARTRNFFEISWELNISLQTARHFYAVSYFEMNEAMLLVLTLSLDNIFGLNFDSERDHCAWIMSELWYCCGRA